MNIPGWQQFRLQWLRDTTPMERAIIVLWCAYVLGRHWV